MIVSDRVNNKLESAKEVSKFMRGLIMFCDESDLNKEKFYVIGLSIKNRVEYVELVSLGTLTASIVHPREVFRMAIIKSCASIIIVHNHPSGDPKPSQEDIAITECLREVGKIMGIKVMDHVILGSSVYGESYFSFAECLE